jgi:hypothetical protein
MGFSLMGECFHEVFLWVVFSLGVCILLLSWAVCMIDHDSLFYGKKNYCLFHVFFLSQITLEVPHSIGKNWSFFFSGMFILNSYKV